MEDCVFCKIGKGELSSQKIYEDDTVVAFLDKHPVRKGHTLVIPRKHIDEFQDMSEDLYEHVMSVVHRLSRSIKERLQPKRVGLVIEGYGVPHAHVHIIPTESPSDIPSAQDMNNSVTNEELESVAKELS